MSITLCHDGMTPRDDGGLRVAISIVKNDEFWRTIFRETTLISASYVYEKGAGQSAAEPGGG